MATTRVANVVIDNQSGANISDITVTHRFGDDAPDYLVWADPMQTGDRSSGKLVRYKTGFGAMTSYDWWIITWKSNGNLHTSSPSLLNYFVDFISKGASTIATAGAAVVAHELAGSTSPEAEKATSGTTLLVACAGIFLGTILKRDSKAEYKEFMLRADDAASGVTITIEPKCIKFSAASGTATTSYQTAPIPADIAAQLAQPAPGMP